MPEASVAEILEKQISEGKVTAREAQKVVQAAVALRGDFLDDLTKIMSNPPPMDLSTLRCFIGTARFLADRGILTSKDLNTVLHGMAQFLVVNGILRPEELESFLK